jgi:hypothetical protein
MLEKLILSKLSEYMDEVEEIEEVRVGRISQELQDEFRANMDAHNAEHDAIKARIDEFIEKIQKEHSCERFQDVDMELWEKVYDELGFTEAERGLKYTIPNASRVVFRKDDVTGQKENIFKN